MHNQAPPEYKCPLCAFIQDPAQPPPSSSAEDIVAETSDVMALISVHQWSKNPGNVIVFPVDHYENLFDLPSHLGMAVHDLARIVAMAMKSAWDCDGISTRQHNGKAGNQDVWHYHVHVTPRFTGDDFYSTYAISAEIMPPSQRAHLSSQLRREIEAIGYSAL
jgi:histidine triad (HIT) family protein